MGALEIWPQSVGYFVTLTFLAVMTSVAVGLRFWARKISGGCHTDDWLTLVAMIVSHALTASFYASFIAYGLGASIAQIVEADPKIAIELLKISLASSILYGTSAFGIRIAVLFFYYRIFPTTRTRLSCYILGGICSAWYITLVILFFTSCLPFESVWEPAVDGQCIDTVAYAISAGAINVIIDAATVFLPVYEVAKLQMPRRRRYTVILIFVLGGIATTASFVRLIIVSLYGTGTVTSEPGPTSALLSALAIIEIYVALIGACIPTLGPIYKKP